MHKGLKEYKIETTMFITRTHTVQAHTEHEARELCAEMTYNAVDYQTVKFDHDVEYEVPYKGYGFLV